MGIFDKQAVKITRAKIIKDVTANGSFAIPGGAVLKRVYIFNKTANAVTGGLRVGSAAAGTQYVTAQAVAANGLYEAAATAISPIVQTAGVVYYEAVTGWNSAKLDLRFEYEETILPTTGNDGRI